MNISYDLKQASKEGTWVLTLFTNCLLGWSQSWVCEEDGDGERPWIKSLLTGITVSRQHWTRVAWLSGSSAQTTVLTSCPKSHAFWWEENMVKKEQGPGSLQDCPSSVTMCTDSTMESPFPQSPRINYLNWLFNNTMSFFKQSESSASR